MNLCGYESDSSDCSSENLLQLILDEEEELRRQRKKKLLKIILLVATVTLSVGLQEPDNHFYRERLKWMEHVAHLNSEGPNAFYVLCHVQDMHYPSYMKLCDLIDQSGRKNFEMAKLRTGQKVGVITTPIALHCCLRWLSGGSYHDIHLTAGMGKSSFYNYAHRCISAINECDALAYKFPTTPLEVERAA